MPFQGINATDCMVAVSGRSKRQTDSIFMFLIYRILDNQFNVIPIDAIRYYISAIEFVSTLCHRLFKT